MLRSIGISKKQIISMIMLEALSGGLVGGIIGILAGFLMMWGIPYVLRSINLYVSLLYPYATLWLYLMAGITITMVASISPAVKSSKLNIIQSLKYE